MDRVYTLQHSPLHVHKTTHREHTTDNKTIYSCFDSTIHWWVPDRVIWQDLKGWKMDVTYREGSRSHNPIRHWTSRYRQESITLPWNSNDGRRVAACASWRRDEGSYSTKATSNTYESSYNYQDFCSKIDYCQRKIGSLTYITAIAEVAFGVSMFPRFHESIQTLVLIIIMQRTRYWRSIEF